MRCIFQQNKYDCYDYLVFPHFTPFTQMLSNPYKFPTRFFFRHVINATTIKNFTEISLQLPWRLQNTGQWHVNMLSGMLLSPHFNFGQKTLTLITLGIASEHIYTTFFWTPTSHTLHQLSEDVLFGCFVIALNAAFTQQLSLADEGYKSGSNSADLPTPLWKTPCIHHVSSMEHASFNPVHTTPHSTVTMTHHSSS